MRRTFGDFDVVIISYEVLRNDIEFFKEIRWGKAYIDLIIVVWMKDM
jgi:SNF2 family DNA or RNA helicase